VRCAISDDGQIYSLQQLLRSIPPTKCAGTIALQNVRLFTCLQVHKFGYPAEESLLKPQQVNQSKDEQANRGSVTFA